jgi:ERCC4-type nuclease
MTRMEFGDIAWMGDGRDSVCVKCGVEYKTLSDLLTCIDDGRLVDVQLPGMLLNYDRIYLLVEMGRTRADRPSGILQKSMGNNWVDIVKGGRGFTYRDLEQYLSTLEEFAQVRVKCTYDIYESAKWITAKHSWWTGKGWDDHKSMHKFYVAPPPIATIERPKLIHRVGAQLPDIGWEKAMLAGKHFASTLDMITASEARWLEIKGIGRTIASRIYKAVRGEGGY